MYNKYDEITIFEIENGWLLVLVHKTDPGEINHAENTTIFYKNKKQLLEKLDREMKHHG